MIANKNIESLISELLILTNKENIKIHITENEKHNKYKLFQFIGSTRLNNLSRIKTILTKIGSITIEVFETHFLIGILFQNIKNETGLILSPHPNSFSLDQSFFNQSLDSKICTDLINYGRVNKTACFENIDLTTYFEIFNVYDKVVSEIYCQPNKSLNYLKYFNSFKEYLNYLNGFFTNKEDSGLYSSNHIQEFSRIYYWIIQGIQSIVCNQTQPIVIHDYGTNYAYLPLLLSCLKESKLNGLKINKIIASDIFFPGKPYIKEIQRNFNDVKKIDFKKINLIEDTSLPNSEVSLLIDVLEHMPDEKTAFKVLKKVWDKSTCGLIVHVPFEEIPNKNWGHFISFNKNILLDWGTKLTNCEILSSSMHYPNGNSLIEDGYLILKRI